MLLSDQTWPDVGRGRTDGRGGVLCVPVGSCEQHGPHLPLATDTIIAEALAARLAARRPGVVVAPSLTVTASGEHAGFPGTLSIGTGVMKQVVIELVRSADWADGVVLVNGHGGNREAVDGALATLLAEGRRTLSWWPRPGADGDAHAGHTETSILLALRPELVRADRAEPGVTAKLARIGDRLRTDGVRAVSPNGILGDPVGASVIDGQDLLDRFADDLVAAVGRWVAETATVAR